MHSHQTRLSRWLSLLLFPVLLAACSTAGNQILLFGTDTKYALDISGDATTGQPSFTLGYKRREAVWLPLIGSGGVATHTCTGDDANLQCVAMAGKPGGTHICDSSMNCVAIDSSMHKFIGKETGGNEDAYSVLASFGATNSAGERSLAQFIATGMAARKLAAKDGASLVNTEASTGAEEFVKQRKTDVGLVTNDVVAADGKAVDAAKLDTLMAEAKLNDSYKTTLSGYKGKSITEFGAALTKTYNNLATLMANAIRARG